MVSSSQIKRGIKNPRLVLKKIGRELVLKKQKKRKFKTRKNLSIYKNTQKYNIKHSKYPIYFDFLKRILTDKIDDENLRIRFYNNPNSITHSEMTEVIKSPIDESSLVGNVWPDRAYTMIGMMRLENLQFCVEDVINNNVKGDLIETGVWRGGATIFMRLILKKYGIGDKKVYVADSFEGLPKPDPVKYPKDTNDIHHTFEELKINLEQVQNNFKNFGILDDQVKFLKGWFKDTLKDPPFEKLSILRLDGDMYGSTWDVLENLYHKLSIGGYLIVDDYYLSGCKSAVDDFRLQNNISEPMQSIDWTGVYWKKTS